MDKFLIKKGLVEVDLKSAKVDLECILHNITHHINNDIYNFKISLDNKPLLAILYNHLDAYKELCDYIYKDLIKKNIIGSYIGCYDISIDNVFSFSESTWIHIDKTPEFKSIEDELNQIVDEVINSETPSKLTHILSEGIGFIYQEDTKYGYVFNNIHKRLEEHNIKLHIENISYASLRNSSDYFKLSYLPNYKSILNSTHLSTK